MPTHPTLLDIVKARRLLNEYLAPTPMYRSAGFSETLDLELHVKYENFQPIRSFKVRGGLYTMSLLDEAQRARGVTTASTGNHGQGIAYGGGALGVPVTVVVPHGTPEVKSEAIMRLGAELVVHGEKIADGFERSREISAETGMVYIEDGEDFGLMAGAGTIGLEIMEDLPDVDSVVLPVGGGNLIAGVGTAIKAINPGVRLIGVQASNAPSVYRSWQEGRTVTTESCDTFAGGTGDNLPGRTGLRRAERPGRRDAPGHRRGDETGNPRRPGTHQFHRGRRGRGGIRPVHARRRIVAGTTRRHAVQRWKPGVGRCAGDGPQPPWRSIARPFGLSRNRRSCTTLPT